MYEDFVKFRRRQRREEQNIATLDALGEPNSDESTSCESSETDDTDCDERAYHWYLPPSNVGPVTGGTADDVLLELATTGTRGKDRPPHNAMIVPTSS